MDKVSSMISNQIIEQVRAIVTFAGAEFDGIQEAVFGAPARIIFQTTKDAYVFDIPFDPQSFDKASLVPEIEAAIRKFRYGKQEKKKMTLKEKLHKIYDAVNHIEKLGHNKQQNYDFIRSSDVTHAIRKQLTELRVYAEINFEFQDGNYTVARAKEPNAPFAAVNVKCSITFHDLDSNETLTSSGLGSGADVGDKAAYKAQTGALKYALKNAFLVPDEADPEADETVDGGGESNTYRQTTSEEPPDFQEARHEAPRPAAAPKTEKPAENPAATQEAPLPPPPAAVPTEKQQRVPAEAPKAQTAAPEQGDAYEDSLPTEEELTVYRAKFSKLGDELSDKGKLKSSKGLPINRKLLVFLLAITKADDAKNITTAQWNDFFVRVEKAKALETGLVGLGQLVNKANGIEDTKKAK